MKYYIHKSMSERLFQADEAIEIGRSEKLIKESLARRGYDEQEFVIGAGYVATVKAIDILRRDQLGRQVVATAVAKDTYLALRRNFDIDRKVVRLVLRDYPAYADELRVREKAEKGRAEFILQARDFYKRVSEHAEATRLLEEGYGMAPGFMKARLATVDTLSEALVNQQMLKGQLTKVTQQRREAMKILDAWMGRYISIARIVFKDEVATLAKLGIRVKRRKAS